MSENEIVAKVKWTPEDYAKSAEKYKIALGPWKRGGCSGRMIEPVAGYVGDGFIADTDLGAHADQFALLPDTLLERDRLKEVVLPKCVEALHLVLLQLNAQRDGGRLMRRDTLIESVSAALTLATQENAK